MRKVRKYIIFSGINTNKVVEKIVETLAVCILNADSVYIFACKKHALYVDSKQDKSSSSVKVSIPIYVQSRSHNTRSLSEHWVLMV